jgi:Raffinose synthase or seed imbibition protein Sip1
MTSSGSWIDIGALAAPAGVELTVDDAPHGRHVRLRATIDLRGFATRRFARPAAAAALSLATTTNSDEPQLLGLAFTQFALPVVAGPSLDFDFRPAPNLHSPSALGLLLIRSRTRTTLLAPLTNVHEQIVSVADGALRWGWHGDLDDLPAGYETTLGVYDGASPTDVMNHWVEELCAGERPEIRRRDTNPLTSHLSYWTDNGAAYWYRTEPGRTIGATVAEAVERLCATGVPVTAVELDSWFYPHETPRPIAEIGYPSDVPPTGMMRWAPRPDAFDDDPGEDGRDAIERWADAAGHPPLVLHARHVSPASPYLDEGGDWWVDDLAAQPIDPEFFRRWFDDAARWGACCIEQDWMLMYWFGVRAMRAAPGRAARWQAALDRHAGDTDLGLLWCMATPADLILAASLPNVIAVRTSDDYRFAEDPAVLWIWFLTVNRLAGALGLPAFKDVFFSQRPAPEADSIDGDAHAEFEALLSALSAGPVGIGDRIGHTDAGIVLRTCDDDGRIRHVDHPVALVDDCLFGAPASGTRLAWATTTATSGGEVWTYVLAVNASIPAVAVDDALSLTELGLTDTRSVLEWRTGAVADLDRLATALSPRDWAFYVVAPPDRTADAGDLTKYVTVPTDRP